MGFFPEWGGTYDFDCSDDLFLAFGGRDCVDVGKGSRAYFAEDCVLGVDERASLCQFESPLVLEKFLHVIMEIFKLECKTTNGNDLTVLIAVTTVTVEC